jgi:hypothetical protein
MMRSKVLWIVTLCSFGGISSIFRVSKPSKEKKQPTVASSLSGLLFDTEDGSNMFLQNVGLFLNYL